jgi:4-methyl-5(b-hydroxyethyl)-thiazole monophosphate biosynthesis
MKATCYPGYEKEFTDAEAVNERVVVDGNCITSQGPATAIEYALKLLEVLFDADKAQKVGQPMLAMQ